MGAVKYFLVLIHPGVRFRDNLVQIVDFFRPAGTDGRAAHGICAELGLQIPGSALKKLLFQSGTDDHEFIPADPVKVGAGERVFHSAGAFRQNLVAVGVAVLVVDVL